MNTGSFMKPAVKPATPIILYPVVTILDLPSKTEPAIRKQLKNKLVRVSFGTQRFNLFYYMRKPIAFNKDKDITVLINDYYARPTQKDMDDNASGIVLSLGVYDVMIDTVYMSSYAGSNINPDRNLNCREFEQELQQELMLLYSDLTKTTNNQVLCAPDKSAKAKRRLRI